jgi:hypothetical protein
MSIGGQVGKGPWSSEVSGIVKIGQTMTMVLGIKGGTLGQKQFTF